MGPPAYAWDFSFLWHYRVLILWGLGVTIAYTIGTILLGTANAFLVGASALILSVFFLSRGRAVRGDGCLRRRQV